MFLILVERMTSSNLLVNFKEITSSDIPSNLLNASMINLKSGSVEDLNLAIQDG